MPYRQRPLWRRTLLIVAGATLYALGIVGFARPAGLFPGGFTGLSLLIQQICQRYLGFTPPYSLFSLSLNFIAAALCFRYIGKRFALFSMLAVTVSSVLTDVLPGFSLASDPLLNSVFGGLVNGLAISLCLRADASTGGTDFISIYLAEKSGRDAFNIILAGNVIMLSAAGLLFGWERALYSMIFQFCTTQALHTLFRRYQHRTLWIVTDKPDEVYAIIRDATHHGATLFQGTGLYLNQPRSMIYTVLSGDDIRRVVRDVREADPHAFINTQRTDSLTGRFYRRPQD
ncbi:MAG: YitT family protein [Clostridia bacterium]|nr:YitT family protein [Clostridia bacterium]MBR6890314.1 YitT family protein [Clostridia bacterium]